MTTPAIDAGRVRVNIVADGRQVEIECPAGEWRDMVEAAQATWRATAPGRAGGGFGVHHEIVVNG